jgi:phenylacetic acid degradation operon negative regulatory protein
MDSAGPVSPGRSYRQYRLLVTTVNVATSTGQQPRALIVSVYGMYARDLGGWLSVAALIRLMAELGVDEPAVRSAVSRLKRRGMLSAQRVGDAAGYGLSAPAQAILAEGDRRIFARPPARLEDGWVLAVFSVPESERHRRHQLRSRLAGLGFGTVASGVWVAPAHVTDEAHEVLSRDGLAAYVDLFRADHLAFAEVGRRIGQWWDLDRIQQRYRDFLAAYGRVLTGYRNGRTVTDRQAFAHFLAALTDWRRLPYADPGLPAQLLPRGWAGVRAAQTFAELNQRLAAPAERFVRSVVPSRPRLG